MRLRASLPLGLLALSALALAAQGITLKRTPKVGDKASYKVTGTFELQGVDVTLKGTTTEEVLKVDNDTVTTKSVAKAVATVMGTDNEMPDATETTTAKLDGTPVEIKAGDTVSGPGLRLANINLLYLPATPVEMNGTWTAEGKKDEKKDVPGYKINYKLVGEEKVGDWDTYKITAEGGETEGASPTKVKATYWIEKSTGATVRSLAELTDAVFDPKFPPLTGKMDVVRQP